MIDDRFDRLVKSGLQNIYCNFLTGNIQANCDNNVNEVANEEKNI